MRGVDLQILTSALPQLQLLGGTLLILTLICLVVWIFALHLIRSGSIQRWRVHLLACISSIVALLIFIGGGGGDL
jgi:hypothetical protein